MIYDFVRWVVWAASDAPNICKWCKSPIEWRGPYKPKQVPVAEGWVHTAGFNPGRSACEWDMQSTFAYPMYTLPPPSVKPYHNTPVKKFRLTETQQEIAGLIGVVMAEQPKEKVRVIGNAAYLNFLEEIAKEDVAGLLDKDKSYGGSWKKRGGVGAFMQLCRKWDRLELQTEKHGYDIFQAIEADIKGRDQNDDILDDIRDLRRYLMLVEAEMLAREIIK